MRVSIKAGWGFRAATGGLGRYVHIGPFFFYWTPR